MEYLNHLTEQFFPLFKLGIFSAKINPDETVDIQIFGWGDEEYNFKLDEIEKAKSVLRNIEKLKYYKEDEWQQLDKVVDACRKCRDQRMLKELLTLKDN